MPYIGSDPSNRFVAPKAASVFSGDGSTTAFTLDHAVGSDEDILVSVDGVIQEPSVAYAVSSGTTLTFTAAPSSNSGNNIFVYYLFRTVGTVSHPSNNAFTATNGTLTGTLDVTGATTIGGLTTLNGKFLIDGSNNDLMTFRTTGDTASQVLGLQFQNNSEAVTAQIFGTGDNSTSGVFRIKGIGSVELHGGDVAVSGDATNMLKVDANGHVTMPNQTAFHATKDGTDETNLGVGSTHTMQWASERFDTNLDFDPSNNRFVAPVTGKYFLSATARLEQVDSAASFYLWTIATSNQTYHNITDPNFSEDTALGPTLNLNLVADMDANDTAIVQFTQSGGTAQTDVDGDPQFTFFTGFLIG